MNLVLASGSPRRRALLTAAGLSFTVRTADTDETVDAPLPPEDYVGLLARRKAYDVICAGDELIIAADTVVALDGKIFGKPKNGEHAAQMLRTFSGRTHRVVTGVALRTADDCRVFTAVTQVTFFPLSEGEIADYIATGEPLDKAGGYGIQGKGGLLVSSICGDYSNAVGLPVPLLMRMLKTE